MLFSQNTVTQDWEQSRQNVPGIQRHHTVQRFHRSKPVRMCIQCRYFWETDAQFYSMMLNNFLLAIKYYGRRR